MIIINENELLITLNEWKFFGKSKQKKKQIKRFDKQTSLLLFRFVSEVLF